MNILPKKRWHVRTKDNIARVRRDEAQAAEEEKQRVQRAKLAEQEARTSLLRTKARSSYDGGYGEASTHSTGKEATKTSDVADIFTPEGNINFFRDIEEGKKIGGTNKEYEEEKKAEQEKYEKSIGYLTYLGQDSLEAKGGKAWYEQRSQQVTFKGEDDNGSFMEEVGLKSKSKLDPINDIIKYAGLKPAKRLSLLPRSNTTENKYSLENDGRDKCTLEDVNILLKQSYNKEHKKEKGKVKKRKRSPIDSDEDSKKRRKHKEKRKRRKIDIRYKRKRESSKEYKRGKASYTKTKKYKYEKSHRKSNKRNRYDKNGSTSRSSSSDSNSINSKNSHGNQSESSDDESHDEEALREKKAFLEKLRAERLKREAEERRKAERLLAGKKPDVPDETKVNQLPFQQKYNSQFNPHIARQNMEVKTLEAGVKYWQQ